MDRKTNTMDQNRDDQAQSTTKLLPPTIVTTTATGAYHGGDIPQELEQIYRRIYTPSKLKPEEETMITGTTIPLSLQVSQMTTKLRSYTAPKSMKQQQNDDYQQSTPAPLFSNSFNYFPNHSNKRNKFITPQQIQKSIPNKASSVFHVLDRRINFDALDSANASLYSLLRAWVHDDPYRFTYGSNSNNGMYTSIKIASCFDVVALKKFKEKKRTINLISLLEENSESNISSKELLQEHVSNGKRLRKVYKEKLDENLIKCEQFHVLRKLLMKE